MSILKNLFKTANDHRDTLIKLANAQINLFAAAQEEGIWNLPEFLKAGNISIDRDEALVFNSRAQEAMLLRNRTLQDIRQATRLSPAYIYGFDTRAIAGILSTYSRSLCRGATQILTFDECVFDTLELPALTDSVGSVFILKAALRDTFLHNFYICHQLGEDCEAFQGRVMDADDLSNPHVSKAVHELDQLIEEWTKSIKFAQFAMSNVFGTIFKDSLVEELPEVHVEVKVQQPVAPAPIQVVAELDEVVVSANEPIAPKRGRGRPRRDVDTEVSPRLVKNAAKVKAEAPTDEDILALADRPFLKRYGIEELGIKLGSINNYSTETLIKRITRNGVGAFAEWYKQASRKAVGM